MTHRQRQARRRRHKARPRNWILLGVAVLAAGAVCAALSGVGYVLAVAATAPNVDDLKPLEGVDPPRVPERRAVRDRGRQDRDRGRGRRTDVLLEAREGPDARPGRVDRRSPTGAVRLQPVPEPGWRTGTPKRRAPAHVHE